MTLMIPLTNNFSWKSLRLTEGENFSDFDETRITLEETPVNGFSIISGAYSKHLKDLILTDSKDHIRLFNLKKQKTSLKLRKICKFRKIFSFEQSEYAFLTSVSNSVLVTIQHFLETIILIMFDSQTFYF